MNKNSVIRNVSTVLAKPFRMVALLLCVFLSGCSTIQSSQMLCLVNDDNELREVKRKDWITVEKSPHFGQWRPSLHELNFKGKGELIIYPVVKRYSSIDGPAFLPIIPSPQKLCNPEENNLLRFVYSGDPKDIHIETVDEMLVDSEAVKKTPSLGETMISLKLDESFVSDGRLLVKIFCRDEQKLLTFEEEKFKMFIPFIFPASSAP